MPKYNVQIARDVRKYYRIVIDAPSEGYATTKAEEIWRQRTNEFEYEAGEDESFAWEVSEVTEVE